MEDEIPGTLGEKVTDEVNKTAVEDDLEKPSSETERKNKKKKDKKRRKHQKQVESEEVDKDKDVQETEPVEDEIGEKGLEEEDKLGENVEIENEIVSKKFLMDLNLEAVTDGEGAPSSQRQEMEGIESEILEDSHAPEEPSDLVVEVPNDQMNSKKTKKTTLPVRRSTRSAAAVATKPQVVKKKKQTPKKKVLKIKAKKGKKKMEAEDEYQEEDEGVRTNQKTMLLTHEETTRAGSHSSLISPLFLILTMNRMQPRRRPDSEGR